MLCQNSSLPPPPFLIPDQKYPPHIGIYPIVLRLFESTSTYRNTVRFATPNESRLLVVVVVSTTYVYNSPTHHDYIRAQLLPPLQKKRNNNLKINDGGSFLFCGLFIYHLHLIILKSKSHNPLSFQSHLTLTVLIYII